jgi:hypothetical protein
MQATGFKISVTDPVPIGYCLQFHVRDWCLCDSDGEFSLLIHVLVFKVGWGQTGAGEFGNSGSYQCTQLHLTRR